MRFVLAGAFAALALGGAAGCSGASQQTPPPQEAAAISPSQAPPPTASARRLASELVEAADLELFDLNDIRLHSQDPLVRGAISRQITSLSAWRNRVVADLSTPLASPRPRLHVDVSNLERAMRAGAATQPQARPDGMAPFGGYPRAALPPNR